MKIRILIGLMLALSLCCPFSAQAESPEDFIRVDGAKLVHENGLEFISRGIQFSNAYSYWEPTLVKSSVDHDESSYAEIAEMGFNTVRFSIDKRYFDTAEGFEWMDRNIAWARKYGVRLIPTLHVFSPFPLEECEPYWSDPSVRQVYVDFWKEYAEHYRDEPVILGYDLLNEPPVYLSGGDYDTARRMLIDHTNEMIAAIRSVDNNHIIFVEGMFNVVDTAADPYVSTWHESIPENKHLFMVNDDNIVYSIHNYYPSNFAMQDMDWHGSAGMFAVYPDDLVWMLPNGVTTPHSLPGGTTTQWVTLTTTYTAPEDIDVTGHVIMAGNAIGENAKVWFDNVVLKEYDKNNNYVRTVMTEDFSSKQYSFYAPNGAGSSKNETSGGIDDSACVSICGTTGRSFVVMDKYRLKRGYHYVLTASVRGDHVDSQAFAAPEFDLYRNLAENDKDSSREKIRQYLKPNVQFCADNNVPIWMGEFGTTKASCQEDRGGDRWIEDVMELCAEENIHYCYYSYHDEWFGLWESSGMEEKANLSTIKKNAMIYGNDLNTVNVTVTFNANGGSGVMKSQTFKRDTAAALKANSFERPGYVFAGWNTKEDGSGASYADRNTVNLSANMVLFARWQRNKGSCTYLPDKLVTIDSHAFEGTSFEAVVLGEYTASIGSRAFADCANLVEIAIPASVTSIADDAFAGCRSDLVITGTPGSAAQSYAKTHGYVFLIN